MGKLRIADLASELRLDPKELLLKLREKGYFYKSINSTVTENEGEEIRRLFTKREVIVIKKEEMKKEEPSVISPEHLPLEVEAPKKKKLIVKKKAEIKEEPKVEEVPPKGPEPEEILIFEEKSLAEKPSEEVPPSIEGALPVEEAQVERRVVTEFKPRKEKPWRSKPTLVETKPIITEIPPLPEKEEIKKKRKETEGIEERKKPKKKATSFKRGRREEFEEFFEEEVESLFEELPEEIEAREIVKPPIKKEKVSERPATLPPKERKIKIYESIQVGELAKLMGVKVGDLIKKALQLGMPLTITQSIDPDTAAILADEFGYQIERATLEEEILLQYIPPSPEELKPRPPVVTVMGHVDHGKTTLLDAIRKTDVVSREAGGITQHIGAYTVTLENNKQITFIDTPGHEAFTSMRARGAQVTDIVILVVAADDGVMEQTKEAIEHAKAAGVPIVVAINKIDKPNANPERVKAQLAELGLVPEEWGGDTLMAEISARNRIGIEELLELVLLQAEVLDLKAAYERPARGRVIETKVDKGRGAVATILIQEGTLKEGDVFVSGNTYGRVRAMFDCLGNRVKFATPATPVEILGFEELPSAGDDFFVIEDEEKARKVAEYRQRKAREAESAKAAKISLERVFEKLKEGELKELKIVLKGDTQGTLEAIQNSLQKLSTEKVKVNVIRSGVGAISESDVMLASASEAIVIGFNVKPTSQAKEIAKKEGVDIRFYDVIYHLLEDIKKAMVGLLEPKLEEVIGGVAEVRATFKVPKVGVVAGCYVKEGIVNRNHKIRVIRDGVVIYTGKIASLKRFKEDVREVSAGYECGIKIENFNDVKEGDLLETFEIREVAQIL
ncbi:MAG: translation initiation factor IF-2 [Caldimicrobium sp.]|nr:translation initiation factor IF-2 [Caldimicrobium sp.]MCX7874407.1 translation initiation factor IF-2 [Caldimicrobium sp.]MDW8094008.1 translation initiation factor IF-2 [Caldimicrobium sp.]